MGVWRRGQLCLVALLVATAWNAYVAPERASSEEPRPNVVLIVLDDMRWDEMQYMPTVQRELVDRGMSFEKSYVENAICCPSRTTTLTGQPSSGTGVYTNSPPDGGFFAFGPGDDDSTLPVWLRAAGYRTGLVGKYLNGYDSEYVPPGWDIWVALNTAADASESGNGYYDYSLNWYGKTTRSFGDRPQDYSTDVFGAAAERFVGNPNNPRPFFLMFAPFAPHGAPEPAPRHEDSLIDEPVPKPPNYYEADVSDKPEYIQQLSPIPVPWADGNKRLSLETLLSVDEAIDDMITTLEANGKLADTMIIFTSDHGLSRGSHRWFGKKTPYEETLRVPLVIRYDRVLQESSVDRDRLVLNLDLARTIAEATGVVAPGAGGHSLMPLLRQEDPVWRSDFTFMHLAHLGDPVPTYCGLRNFRWKYVYYSTGEQELYDLFADPYELRNVADDPIYATQVLYLARQLYRKCDPAPPGLEIPDLPPLQR